MKHLLPLAVLLSIGLWACDRSNPNAPPPAEEVSSSSTEETKPVVAVDYSLGRAMNKRLGKGINLGNAWDGASYWTCGTLNYDYETKTSDTTIYTVNGVDYPVYYGSSDAQYYGNLPKYRYNNGEGCADKLDASWSNPIKDEYFQFLKEAGFNSVRIPVRWQHNSDPVTHKVNPERLAGVKEDVQLAIDAGLAVVISFHWYYEMNFFAANAAKFPELYQAEKEHFAAIWSEVATEFKDFPDTMLVWDIMNEPTMGKDKLNEVLMAGYDAIRAADPNKTIMFESYQSAKFRAIKVLDLPQDGNIIYSGHYYEPYTYSHQGHNDMYACKGDAAFESTAMADMTEFIKLAMSLYPDVKKGSYVPMNMGEFGISGGPNDACARKGETGPSEKNKALWAEKAIEAAEAFGLSWHYWGFVNVGGFEAYNGHDGAWYAGFPAAFRFNK